MNANLEDLKHWLTDMASEIEQNANPNIKYYDYFIQNPQLALQLVDLLHLLDVEQKDNENGYYSACICALGICVGQLQISQENGNKLAAKTLNQLMAHMAQIIKRSKQGLNFWLPSLNAFYEVHVELTADLKDAYRRVAMQEDEELLPENEAERLYAMKEMIDDIENLSAFDIAEDFFAQSYAMPADFFSDLVIDLSHTKKAQDVALLCLLHPQQEVRDMVVATFEELINNISLSSTSLSRLKVIKTWYPVSYQQQFDRWIRIQRKKGVVFACEIATPNIQIKASEVDGNGAQGILIHIKEGKKNRFCGLLFKQEFGIKEAWVTPEVPASKIAHYYDEAFHFNMTLREVDAAYLTITMNHFLALTLKQGKMPNLRFLEIQELLGLHFQPRCIDISYIIDQIGVQITPFTADIMQSSFKRSRSWFSNKRFAGSWYAENAHIDQIVNRYCSFIDGTKICDTEEAIRAVIVEELESARPYWLFHFLWTALWLKSRARKNEKAWQDSFFIAYAIHSNIPLKKIPIMQEIAYHTVFNSLQTMLERRTHLGEV